MKYLIITVAGTATRFNRDTKEDTLKCLYYTDNSKYSLLSQLLKNCGYYDKYIIVGGYLFDKLEQFANNELGSYRDKIELVFNEHFRDYGSGYSLFKGIEAVNEQGDVTFVEGDLFFNADTFKQVYDSSKNVITINREPIYSDKAVALYINSDGKPRYLYDTNHKTLIVPEAFRAIFNSGQMWKFASSEKLHEAVCTLTETQLHGTNLEIVQAYFGDMNPTEYDVVSFSEWFNCNTVADYEFVRKLM
ncbi:MAG: licC domain protein [Salinivirgaceae bacterium]|nr:licC domain protein [Salinivirgaceae bacterium]